MFELDVETNFAAAHALRGYRGKCESLHGHNYKVRMTVSGDTLDEVGMLCDFKWMKSVANEALEQFDHKNLNDLEPFRRVNPTAEHIAQHLFRQVQSKMLSAAPDVRARVVRVRVWETDGCSATYFE